MDEQLNNVGEKFTEELVKAMPNFRIGWLIVVEIAVFPVLLLWAFINWIFIKNK